MRGAVRFVMGGRIETLAAPDPDRTVLQWLRGRGRTGAKDGCAGGDCGACTVALGELDGEEVRYRSANACILLLPMLDGRQLVTVEDLAEPGGILHPVQHAVTHNHASQCGFCMPGIAMSLFALFQAGARAEEADMLDALAGNLCRCTGYRPILEAAESLRESGVQDRFAASAAHMAALLKTLRHDAGLAVVTADGRNWFAPRTLPELEALLAAHPDAQLVAGATGLGPWVAKGRGRLGTVIALHAVEDLRIVAEGADVIDIGAAAPIASALPVLARHWPPFGTYLRRLGAAQIRNMGSFGGNLADAGVGGEAVPPLLALDAVVVLNQAGARRELALHDLFAAHARFVRQPGEFIERIRIPIDRPGFFSAYKVAKRRDQDIAAVTGAFRVDLDGGAVVREARLAYGGAGPGPVLARQAEQALIGQPWTADTVAAAMAALDHDLAPASDVRAGAAYRMLVARNLLMRFYRETTGQAEPLEAVHA